MIDRQAFRDAMARLAAAVNIVTSDGPAGLCGSTASAVCSVSDAPPILLVCINRSSRNNAVFKGNGRLCVNVLRAEHESLALQFSASGSDMAERFAAAAWSACEVDPVAANTNVGAIEGAGIGSGTDECAGANARTAGQRGSPMLDGALVSLDCRITGSAEVGSHTVFYCTVEACRFGDAGDGLVYFWRGFHRVLASQE